MLLFYGQRSFALVCQIDQDQRILRQSLHRSYAPEKAVNATKDVLGKRGRFLQRPPELTVVFARKLNCPLERRGKP